MWEEIGEFSGRNYAEHFLGAIRAEGVDRAQVKELSFTCRS